MLKGWISKARNEYVTFSNEQKAQIGQLSFGTNKSKIDPRTAKKMADEVWNLILPNLQNHAIDQMLCFFF